MNRLMEEFLLFKADNKGLADRSIRACRDILQRFEDWLEGRDPLTIDGDQLLAFTGPYLHKALHLAPVSRSPYVACIRELEFAGIVEDTGQFKKDLIVMRRDADVGRVNAVLPPNRVNQFVNFGAAV